MISALRILKLAPWIALAAVIAGGVWLLHDHREQAIEISQLEATVAERNASILTLEQEKAALAEQHLEDMAALEAELERQAEQTDRYRAARESLDGLEDGEVAPVLMQALEALR